MRRYKWGETSESMKFEFRNQECLLVSNSGATISRWLVILVISIDFTPPLGKQYN